MKKVFLFTMFCLTAIMLSAQTNDETITLTQREFGIACNSTDIHSFTIDNQIYYYTLVENKPTYAVIVAKKKAYNEFKEVFLPEKLTGDNGEQLIVVAIGNRAFEKCKNIKTVDLPKSVRIIGDYAFQNTDVDKLSLKEGLVKIGDGAFYNNDLKDIAIPEGVEQIGQLAFYCYKSTIFQRNGSGTLYIPKSVYEIGDHAFAMTRNGYGAWFNSKRKILCLPDFINLDNCKKMGISRDSVEEYLNSNK